MISMEKPNNKVNKMNRWRNYNIRYEFKNTNGLEKDIQMLCYMNNKLAYTSKKNSFKRKTIKTDRLKLNKWRLPHYEPIEKSILIWSNNKEYNRFINFCKKFKFKTCYALQEELRFKQGNYKN